MKKHLKKFESFGMEDEYPREEEMGREEEMMPPYYQSKENEFSGEEEEMMPHEMEDEFSGEEEEMMPHEMEDEFSEEEDEFPEEEFNEIGEEMPMPREERFEERFRSKNMRHLKRFENFSQSTEEETSDFMGQFGEESDSANTVGLGTPCGECNCVVEDCKCGCHSCKDKQKSGMSFKREPYKQDYTAPDRNPLTESRKSKKSKPDFLDLDKDGDKKESMKKAAKEAKGKKEDKGGKGLTAKQKKLPEGLRKAIEARKKK